MRASDIPLVLWDYCAKRRARMNNLTERNLLQLQGQNTTMGTLGEEGDISNLCNFQWFEWFYFRDQGESFTVQKESLRRVLGTAKNCGNEMSQWILSQTHKLFHDAPFTNCWNRGLPAASTALFSGILRGAPSSSSYGVSSTSSVLKGFTGRDIESPSFTHMFSINNKRCAIQLNCSTTLPTPYKDQRAQQQFS